MRLFVAILILAGAIVLLAQLLPSRPALRTGIAIDPLRVSASLI
jgi:hypothetical protein